MGMTRKLYFAAVIALLLLAEPSVVALPAGTSEQAPNATIQIAATTSKTISSNATASASVKIPSGTLSSSGSCTSAGQAIGSDNGAPNSLDSSTRSACNAPVRSAGAEAVRSEFIPDAEGSLTGNVSDGLGDALPSTVVIDQQNTTNVVAQGTTDSNGDFNIAVSGGTYDVVVAPQSSSYLTRTIYEVTVSGVTTLDVVLVETGTGALTGTLVDDQGQPVSNVVMALSGPSVPTVSYTTGSTGTFSLTVPNGYYQMHLYTNNCSTNSGDVPNETYDGCYWDLYTAPGALTVSGNINFGDVALPRPAHITATVLNPSNQPIQGATFNIANTSCVRCGDSFNVAPGLTFAGLPITSGDTFLWNNTPPTTNAAGKASILAWPSTSTENFTVTPPTSTGLTAVSLNNVPLSGDQSVTVNPPVGDVLTGTLVDDQGQPVSNVVMALSGPSVPTVSYTTGSTGTFSLTVPNGYYQMHLYTNNCSTNSGDVPNETYDGCYWDLYTAPGALTVSGNINFGDVALPRPAHITATVLNPSNQPIQGATFNIANTSCVRCGDSFNVAPGLTFAGLPITSGDTFLWNNTPPTTNAAGKASILAWPSTSTENFTVTPPTSTGLTAVSLNNVPLSGDQSVTVNPPVGDVLTGTLVDDQGQPVSNVVMALSGPSVPTVSYTTGSTGTFSLTVPNGYYQMHLYTNNCSTNSGDVPNETYDGCYWDLYTAPGALTVSGKINFGDVALPRPAHITATVLNPSNQPIQGATFNIANTSCVRCGDSFNVAPGLTFAGLPITSGDTFLWNNTPPTTNAAGKASILAWPSTSTENFTVTPPTSTGLTAVSLNNVPLSGDVNSVILYQAGGQVPVILQTRPAAYTMSLNGNLEVGAPGVMASDTVDSSATAVLVTPPSDGTITFESDGSFDYVPDPGFSGEDQFTYDVTQDGVTSSPVSVTITVTKLPDTTAASVTPTSTSDGNSVTYTATVSPLTSTTLTPTGTVVFTAGTTTLCTAPVTSGASSCNSTAAPVGNDTITATYSGDAHLPELVGDSQFDRWLGTDDHLGQRHELHGRPTGKLHGDRYWQSCTNLVVWSRCSVMADHQLDDWGALRDTASWLGGQLPTDARGLKRIQSQRVPELHAYGAIGPADRRHCHPW